MWLELGKDKNDLTKLDRMYLNLDHVARVEFIGTTAKVISTKPGGSDTTVLNGEDVERLRQFMWFHTKRQTLEYEIPEVPETPKPVSAKRVKK